MADFIQRPMEVPWKIKRTFCDVVLWWIIKFMLKPLGSNSIISLLQAVTRQKITVTDPTAISKQVFTGGQAGDIYLPFPAFVLCHCGRCAGPGRHRTVAGHQRGRRVSAGPHLDAGQEAPPLHRRRHIRRLPGGLHARRHQRGEDQQELVGHRETPLLNYKT